VRVLLPSSIQTFTVGFGIQPNHAQALVGYTTDRELHPAPKVVIYFLYYIICRGDPPRGIKSS